MQQRLKILEHNIGTYRQKLQKGLLSEQADTLRLIVEAEEELRRLRGLSELMKPAETSASSGNVAPNKNDERLKLYHEHAEEIRIIAEGLNDEESRKTLMDVADQYEELGRLSAAMSKA